MKVRATIFFFVLLTASRLSGFGQGFQGGLRGAARDSAGAVVPGVEVTLLNEATSLSRATITNDSGEYNFAALEPGKNATDAIRSAAAALDLPGKYQARVRLTGPIPSANEGAPPVRLNSVVSPTLWARACI